MAWLTEDEIKDAVASVEQRASRDDLDPVWDERVTRADAAARNEITTRLVVRGYTAAQVESWDRVAEFHRHLSLWFALIDGNALQNYQFESVKVYDRRKDLDAITLTVGGAIVTPGGLPADGSGFAAGGGRMDESGYRFSMDTQF